MPISPIIDTNTNTNLNTTTHTNSTLDTNTKTANTRVWGENSAHAYLTNYRGRRQSRGGFPHLVSNTTCRRWSVGEGMWPSRSRSTRTSSASSTSTSSMSSASSRGSHVFKWQIVATLSMWVWTQVSPLYPSELSMEWKATQLVRGLSRRWG